MTIAPDLTIDALLASAVPARLPGGNTAWAARYGEQLRNVIVRQASRQPRTLQAHLGPSELGIICDRQVVSKMTAQPLTNHVIDPWPSVMGIAGHALLAEWFERENTLDGGPVPHWLPETRVIPVPEHPGTSDLFDTWELVCGDHKFLGPTTLAELKAKGPSRQYFVQLLLYGLGWRNAGWPVHRVALIGWPRAAASLDEMYVWEHKLTPADDTFINQVLYETELRKAVAKRVLAREIRIEDVPMTPGSECRFCPVYRPQSARDGGPGCPGNSPRD